MLKTSYAFVRSVFIIILQYRDLVTHQLLLTGQVNKFFLALSEHRIIWKRLLRRTTFPLPPLPPTSRYSYNNLTSLEAERLLVRAVSLDKNWRELHPYPLDLWSFDAYNTVNSMVLVPGGRYLIASVGNSTHRRYQLMIYLLDHRCASLPIAWLPTDGKAYQLQAKYLYVQEKHGIAISFMSSRPQNRADAFKYVISSCRDCGWLITYLCSMFHEYNGGYDMDMDVPFVHEYTCMHVSIDDLEALGDVNMVPASAKFIRLASERPAPFRKLLRTKSRKPFGPTALFSVYGVPYLAVVKLPNIILFKSLTKGTGLVRFVLAETVEPGDGNRYTLKVNPILSVR